MAMQKAQYILMPAQKTSRETVVLVPPVFGTVVNVMEDEALGRGVNTL